LSVHAYDTEIPMKLPAKVAAGVVLLLVPAHGQVQLGDRLLPPVKYDKPYDGRFLFKRGQDEFDMIVLCPKKPPMGYPRLGCSYRNETSCAVVMATDEMIRKHGIDPDVVWRHEIAHCNGWPANHEGAR
jgi:hypothetical protein